MKSWIFDRSDFDGNPHYKDHFDDLCSYLGLQNEEEDGKEIDRIIVYIDKAEIEG